jgi:hypothetical protein
VKKSRGRKASLGIGGIFVHGIHKSEVDFIYPQFIRLAEKEIVFMVRSYQVI